MDQLLVQVEEGGPRPCGVEGESSVEVWTVEMVGICWLLGGAPLSEGRAPFRRAHPFQKGRVLIAYLIGRGLKPLLIT